MTQFSDLTRRQQLIMALAAATSLIHLGLGISSGGLFGLVFILNGLAFLGLILGRYLLPQLAAQRRLLHWGLAALTAVTFLLYFLFNPPSDWNAIGLITKAIELALLILLWQDRPQS